MQNLFLLYTLICFCNDTEVPHLLFFSDRQHHIFFLPDFCVSVKSSTLQKIPYMKKIKCKCIPLTKGPRKIQLPMGINLTVGVKATNDGVMTREER